MDGTCKNDGNNNVFDGGTLFVTGTIFCRRRRRRRRRHRRRRRRRRRIERNAQLE